MKRLIVCASAAMLVAACGATGIGAGSSPTPVPSPTSGGAYAAVVTEKDHSATLRVGQRLEVVLRAAGGMTNWSHPVSSDRSVLAPAVDPAATAVRGVTLAAFVALTPGKATLTSYAGPQCSPGQACPMLAIAFSASVTVTG